MHYIRIYLNNVLMDQVELNKDQLTIGRSADSDIVLDNAGVSSRGLHGIADPDVAQDGELSQDGTMEVNIADVKDLLKLREKKKTAYVELRDAKNNQSRFIIKEQNCRIGRSKECDIRTTGWLSLGLAAEIQRNTAGYHLLAKRWGRVMINEEP